jgi:ABC-type Mn2+/Zn2+ transport system ATPase subunit
VEGGDFTWEAGSSEASLSDVNFTAAPGTLTMVVGSVGSGKSSVLAALIGQMERVKGTVAIGGRVAYVAQTAWIVNDSVQVRVCGRQQQLGGGSKQGFSHRRTV